MTGAELFIAIGGTVVAGIFIAQALRRNKDEDAYLRRGDLTSMLRSPTSREKAEVPLRPAAARLLARRKLEESRPAPDVSQKPGEAGPP